MRRYYHVLVQQKPLAGPAPSPGAAHVIGSDGTKDIAGVHAWRGWNGHDFTLPVVARYHDPERFARSPALT